MILSAFFAALGQMGDPRFRRVFLLGLGITIAILALLTFGAVQLVGALVGDTATLPLIGEVGWLDNVASWSAVLVMLVFSVVLMVPVASAVISLFLEQVADAVEDVHYPGLPEAPGVPIVDGVIDAIGALALLLVANLLALVLYVLFPPFALFIFWGLNGFLLGREYYTLVAMRRLGRAGAKRMRRRHRLTIWAAGTLMAIPLTIPILNLLVPIIGAATFTHIYHRLPGK
jgi:CysZ protein